jgi:hypothetical protein
LSALAAFLKKRSKAGVGVLITSLNCSQGNRYLELAEARAKDEDNIYGWVSNRVMQIG